MGIIFQVKIDDKPLWQRIIERDGYNGQPVTATGRMWKDTYQPLVGLDGNITHILIKHKGAMLGDKLRRHYYVGQTRALLPGRGKPGVWYRKRFVGEYPARTEYDYMPVALHDTECWDKIGFRPARIRITSLQKLDVRQMTDAQAQRTGFSSAVEYLMWWAIQYDSVFRHCTTQSLVTVSPADILTRPAAIYTAVFIGFEFMEVA